MSHHPARKLAVILHTDVIGSTELVQRNESLAHERIVDAFKRFSAIIESYAGIAHEIRGDALLAEFGRASDAVTAALSFQTEQTEYNKHIDDDIRPALRVGISMGEVIIADDTMTGAGVVMAQRLEQLADSGGVVIQSAVYETMPRRLPFDYENLGEQQLKGFEEAVRAYRVALQAGGELPPAESTTTLEQASDFPEPAPALPDKPSVAVLPFTNMSGDPGQEYFSDGLSEGLITTFSKASQLLVIARSSSFTYKNKSVNVQQIASELGVDYVLEGSVQRAGNRIRINAQLIDGRTGHHIWADRYDRDADDLFALQDEITFNILTACQVTLVEGEQARMTFGHDEPVNLPAIELLWQAVTLLRKFNKRDNATARDMLKRSKAMGGENAQLLALLGYTYLMEARSGWSQDSESLLSEANTLALRSLELNESSASAKSVLANIALIQGEHEKSVLLSREAVALEPSNADENYVLGIMLNYADAAGQAVDALESAMRLSPYYPVGYLYQLGISRYLLREYDAAIKNFDRCVERNPQSAPNHVWLAILHAESGRSHESIASAQRAIRLDRELTVERWVATEPFRNPEVTRRMTDAMLAAGLPSK